MSVGEHQNPHGELYAGKKRRGRPKETWRRTVERELKERGLSLETAPWTAADQPKWRALTTASSARQLRED